LVSYTNSALGNLTSPNTLGRTPLEGYDTDTDNSDWTSFATPTEGRRNNTGTIALANTLTAPASPIPRKFKIDLTLGEDSSGGTTDTIWFIRTGGSLDTKSPHIYRLTDLGFNLSSTSSQSKELVGVSTNDIDGNPLVDGTVYKVILNTDTAVGSASQIIKTNVTYDASTHNISIIDSSFSIVDNSAKIPLLKINITDNSPSGMNNIELTSVKVKFTDGTGTIPLSTSQAQALFGNLFIYKDNASGGTIGTYQPAYDTTILASIANNSISLDENGIQIINITNPNSSDATVSPGTTNTYFLVAELTSNASSASPNNFKATIDGDVDVVIRDSYYDVVQTPNPTVSVSSTSSTCIAPAPPPTGTTYPKDLGGTTEAMTAAVAINRYSEIGLYAGTNSGKLYALNNDGTIKWTTPFVTTGPINSTPQVSVENGNTFIYVANDAGYLYKIKDLGTSGTTTGGWTLNLGTVIKSSPTIYNGNLYVGANNQKLYKIDASTGNIIWDTSTSITGNLTGSVAVDEWTAGVNSVWIGSEGGSLYRVNTANGQVLSTLTTGGAIKSSPFVDAGYIDGATNNLFITSTDGKIYCRSSTNLTTIPTGWIGRAGQEDGSYNVGSPIESIPFLEWWVSPKALYFGADNGKLYKLNGENGTLIWTYQTKGPIKSSPIVYNGWVYFGSDDGKCYCISTSDASDRTGWPISTGAEVRSMPTLSGWNGSLGAYTSITFTSKDGKVYTFQIQ